MTAAGRTGRLEALPAQVGQVGQRDGCVGRGEHVACAAQRGVNRTALLFSAA